MSNVPERPRRVAYLIDKFKSTGGSQTHLWGLAGGLDPRRFSVTLLCLSRGVDPTDPLRDSGSHLAESLRQRGISVDVVGLDRLKGISGTRGFLRLVAKLRHLKPDILHTYLSTSNVVGAAAAAAARVPCLITSRRDTGFGDSPMMQRALRLSNRWAARVIAVSAEVARIVQARERIQPPRLQVIPNGIDLRRFTPQGRRAETRQLLGVPESTRLLLTVGHLTPIKGVDVLVEAADRVRRGFPRVVFLVVGSGKEHAGIQRLVDGLGLGAVVRLLGERRDVPELLEAADAFVLPSRSEGQPNSVLEAMAAGLPVVATRVGGVPELIADGSEGLLVTPGDPEGLASACLEVLGSPPMARRMGEQARARVGRDFELSRMVCRYEGLYTEVLAERQHQGAA